MSLPSQPSTLMPPFWPGVHGQRRRRQPLFPHLAVPVVVIVPPVLLAAGIVGDAALVAPAAAAPFPVAATVDVALNA